MLASPTRRSESLWSARRLLLERVDLREDLGILGEPVRDLVVPHALAVDVDEEDAARPFLEGGGDAVLGFDGGLQTGGLGEEVSLPAIRDQNVHPILLVPGG